MAYILSIETATQVCSVALHHDGRLLALREVMMQNGHASHITLFVDEVMKEAEIPLKQLDAIAVSKGPGSYTGLRIGVSAAKGLCYALDIPLLSVNTLESMAHLEELRRHIAGTTLLCPMIDARRMEVYTALFDYNYQWVQETAAVIIEKTSYFEQLTRHKILFFGDGAAKCEKTIIHPNAVFLKELYPSAAAIGQLAYEKYTAGQLENLAYFEPYYVKEFVSTAKKA